MQEWLAGKTRVNAILQNYKKQKQRYYILEQSLQFGKATQDTEKNVSCKDTVLQ